MSGNLSLLAPYFWLFQWHLSIPYRMVYQTGAWVTHLLVQPCSECMEIYFHSPIYLHEVHNRNFTFASNVHLDLQSSLFQSCFHTTVLHAFMQQTHRRYTQNTDLTKNHKLSSKHFFDAVNTISESM